MLANLESRANVDPLILCCCLHTTGQSTQGLPALEAVKKLSLGSGEEEVVLIDRRHDTRLAFLVCFLALFLSH